MLGVVPVDTWVEGWILSFGREAHVTWAQVT